MSPTLTLILGTLATLLDTFAIARAILKRRGVDVTLAWIFAILALPGVGAVAYLLLAHPSVGRTARRRRMTREAMRRAVETDARLQGHPVRDSAVLKLAASITGLMPTSGNDVHLLAGSVLAFEEIERAVAGAKRQIWAEYYIHPQRRDRPQVHRHPHREGPGRGRRAAAPWCSSASDRRKRPICSEIAPPVTRGPRAAVLESEAG